MRSGEKWKNLLGLTYEDFIDKDDFLEALLEGDLGNVDAIIHMGACSATTESRARAFACWRICGITGAAPDASM